MKNFVFVSASPKVNEPSVSELLAHMAGERIDSPEAEKVYIDVRQSIMKRRTEQDFIILSKADAIVIVFPLYVFCMPGILTRFLEDYYKYRCENKIPEANTKVYAVINCGFPESGINLEAARVIRSFSKHIGADFRFGVLIGGGGMILGAKDAPFMKKTVAKLAEAFSAIAADVFNEGGEPPEDVYIEMKFPRRLYLAAGNMGWGVLAKKNGLKKKDLYCRPYLPDEA
jgi:multimeric flavodoxin WrbA